MNILLLEDHPIVRVGIRELIVKKWPDANITEAATLHDAVGLIRSEPFDIAITDLSLPDAKGLESVTQLRRASSTLRILVLSFNEEAAYAQRVLQLGAYGYLPKDRAGDDLIRALERIRDNQRYMTDTQVDRLAGNLSGQSVLSAHETLTPQEYRVMLLIAEGMKLTEIGDTMHLSPKTVSTYRARVFEKLGFANNNDLIRYCLDKGIAS